MTATTTPTTVRRGTPRGSLPMSARRVAALATAEVRLLVRNRTALFNSLAMPPLTVALFGALGVVGSGGDPAAQGAGLLVVMTFMSLAFVVYYNLTVAYVARREELVLKRYLVGECSRAEVLAGAAVPALTVALAQTVLAFVAVSVLVEPPTVTNPVLVVLAVVGGAGMLTLLAAATSGLSRTVESAQLTTLPLLLVAMPFAGLFGPPGATSGALGTIGTFTPLRPITDLMLLGATGIGRDGQVVTFGETFTEAAVPVAVLAAWTVVGLLATRRWMRWEPRR